jgi:translation elongation factor EF-G
MSRPVPAPVAYRETIARSAQAEGKLKKQSGGHGQFAVVQLRVSPLPAGSGFEFVDAVVGGAVPRSYISAVEKGARDAPRGGRARRAIRSSMCASSCTTARRTLSTPPRWRSAPRLRSA